MARIDDGFSTTIDFADESAMLFYEKGVTPPGVSGGGENDTTTMRNTAWRTRSPKKLKTLTTISVRVAYDPATYDKVVAQTNNNQEITVSFPDGDTLVFWGWLDEFQPGEIVEGSQPEADVTIICSNQNDSGVETPPVFTAST